MAIVSPRYPSLAAPSEAGFDDITIRDSSTFRLEGFLHKLGYIRRSWKKRWFTVSLIDTRLFYYKTASASVSRGHIDLEEVTNIGMCDVPMADVCFSFSFEKGDYGFFIETPHRTYYLTAENESDRKYWITGLKNFHRHLKSALQSINTSVDSSRYSDVRASIHIAMLSSSHLQATTSVLQNIETVGTRIEKCMETITKRRSNFSNEFQRFAKARHSLCANASIWTEIDQMNEADNEVRTTAYSGLEEASKLMVAIYGLVDDIDLMQAQIERDEIASFSRLPDADASGGFVPDINLERRKKLLCDSIENSWQQVREKLDRLQFLATQMELLKSEVQVLPASLPAASFLTEAIQIPSQQSVTRASFSCPTDKSYLSTHELLQLGISDSSRESPRDSNASNNSSSRTASSYASTSNSSNNFSPFTSRSSFISPFANTTNFAAQFQNNGNPGNGKPLYAAASVATSTINSYRDRASEDTGKPSKPKRSHSSASLIPNPFPGIPLKSADDPFPGIALKTDRADHPNHIRTSIAISSASASPIAATTTSTTTAPLSSTPPTTASTTTITTLPPDTNLAPSSTTEPELQPSSTVLMV